MHPYIPHLLSDILNAHQLAAETPFEEVRQKTIEEELEEIEKWVEGHEAEHTFGYWCGLETFDFPPPEQLTDEEMQIVCAAFEEMMYTWNVDISLPATLPQSLRYTFTINTLKEKTAIMSSGTMTFDYCSGYAPECPFKEHCSCLVIWNELKDKKWEDEMDDESPDDEEKPF